MEDFNFEYLYFLAGAVRQLVFDMRDNGYDPKEVAEDIRILLEPEDEEKT